MDETTRARAFEPFFTTKAEGEGTGLGLAVAYGVVDALRGTLALRSAPGEGTVAEIVLPAAVGAAEELAVEAHVHTLATGPARVLVVEDRDVVRDLAREVLGSAGFDVAVASGGHDALALASDAARFDLLLSDVVMPEMSGPELARRLRAEQPGLPVLYMSGYTDDVLDESELAHPRTGFIRKPFTNRGLIGAVSDTLGYPWAAAALANASSPSSASAG
jgi:CheY-like chemotaxis protein